MKNLPKEVAEARLRDVFSKKGEITDAKLLRSRYTNTNYYFYILKPRFNFTISKL